MATDVYSLPVSTSLLNEVNAVGDPKRNKAQDGTVGDTAHEQRVSDHNRDETGNTGSSHDADNINEVHARDVDTRGPWKIKGGAERIVQLIVANVRAMGHTKRRVKYVISNKRIWVWRQVNGAWQFVQQTYTGSDPHILHFHVSFEYGSGSGSTNPENNTSPWGILAAYQAEQEELPVNQADFDKLFNGYIGNPTNAQKFFDALLNSKVGSKVWPTRTWRNFFGDLWGVRDFMIGDTKGSLPANSGIGPDSPIAKAYKGATGTQPGTVHTTDAQ